MQVIYECLFQILGKKMKIRSMFFEFVLFVVFHENSFAFLRFFENFQSGESEWSFEVNFNAWGHNKGDSLIFFYASQVLRFWSWIEAEIIKKSFNGIIQQSRFKISPAGAKSLMYFPGRLFLILSLPYHKISSSCRCSPDDGEIINSPKHIDFRFRRCFQFYARGIHWISSAKLRAFLNEETSNLNFSLWKKSFQERSGTNFWSFRLFNEIFVKNITNFLSQLPPVFQFSSTWFHRRD